MEGTFTIFRDCQPLFKPNETPACPYCGRIFSRKDPIYYYSVEDARNDIKIRPVYEDESAIVKYVPILEFNGDKFFVPECLMLKDKSKVAARLNINRIENPLPPGELIPVDTSFTTVLELVFFDYKSIDVLIYNLEKLRKYLKENSSKNGENTDLNTD